MKNRLAYLASMFLAFSSFAQAAPHGLYLTHQQKELYRILNILPQAAAGQQLNYFGGPVIANVKVYAVFWGKSVDTTTQNQIGDFFSNTVNSTYMDWLNEYNTNVKSVDGRAGSNQTIGRGTYVGAITITPTHTGQSITDADIQAELDQQIASHVLPKPDANTLFMTYFPPGISISIDGQASCQAFCAYHEGFASKTNGNVFYGVMPDLGGACAWGCGFASSQFDNLTSVSSHELIEAITDPFPCAGNTPAFPQAWNTTDGNEIGDLCVQNETQLTTQGNTYALQQEFDNKSAGCAAGPYQSP